MRTVQLELLRPAEVREEQEKMSIVYLPIGPVEWHSYHMPLGTDGIASREKAIALAKKIGGVVAPTLFIGTEKNRSEKERQDLALPDDYILGMDFPKNILPSMYLREEVFAMIVSEHLRLLIRMGYKMIVILNGHGAIGQVETVKRLADQYTNETGTVCFLPNEVHARRDAVVAETHMDPGHADRGETVLMQYLTDSVDLSKLPPREAPLHTPDFGIANGSQFAGQGPEDGLVLDDPRDSTREVGEAFFNAMVEDAAEEILARYAQIK